MRAVCHDAGMVKLIPFMIVLLCAPAAFAQSVEELDKMEIFVETRDVAGHKVPKMLVTGVVNAPPAKVYEIVGNCDQFPNRMPHVKEAKTLSKSAKSHVCEVTVSMPFPMSNLTSVTVDTRETGPVTWARRWKLRDGENDSYELNSGQFVLTAFNGNPNRTLVKYEIHAVPKTAVPGFVRNTAQKSSLPGLIKRIRKEVAKL